MHKELLGHNVYIESSFMAKVMVPDFIDGITDEFCSRTFNSFKRGVVIEEDGVFGFLTSLHNDCGRIVNNWICLWLRGGGGNGVHHVAVYDVFRSNEANEVVGTVLVMGMSRRMGKRTPCSAVRLSSLGWTKMC